MISLYSGGFKMEQCVRLCRACKNFQGVKFLQGKGKLLVGVATRYFLFHGKPSVEAVT